MRQWFLNILLTCLTKVQIKNERSYYFLHPFAQKTQKRIRLIRQKILNFAGVKSKCNKYMDDYHAENPNL